MAKILKIKIEGFVSVIGKIKYKFDRDGISLILGKNGAGKTTIFNALFWCLYGQTLKPKSSILPWPNIISDEYRGCKVSVELDNNIEIIRCCEFKGKVLGRKGGNRLVVTNKGAERLELRGKVDAQRFINKTLGYSFQLFKTSVLFAQELTSLIEDDGPTKKKTFDEAFSSAFINRAKENADIRLTQLNKDHETITSNYTHKMELLENNRSLLKSLLEADKKFATEKGRSISKLRREIKTLRKENSILKKEYNPVTKKQEIKAQLKDKNNQANELSFRINPGLDKELSSLGIDIEKLSDKLGFMESKINLIKEHTAKCSSCGQKLKGKSLIQHRQTIKQQLEGFKNEREELEGSIKLARKKQERAQKKIEEQSNSVKELKAIREDLNNISIAWETADTRHSEIKTNLTRIKQIKKEITRIRRTKRDTSFLTIRGNIKGYEIGIAADEVCLKDLNKKIEIQKWLIKDPLSNSGLKAFIFDSMLNKVNYYLLYYTKFIGFQVKVAIDLESSNKDFCISIMKGSDEVPYPDLSKGQKQLTKVVLCFALNDSIDAAKPLNIMLMDELFESLDPSNMEVVSNIIKEKAKTKSIHLITHQSSFNPTNSYKTFVELNAKDQTVITQKYKEA